MNDKWTRYGLLVGIVVLLVLFSMVGTSSAYSDNGTYFTCYNCSDCTGALDNNTYDEVRLGADIINHSGACFLYPSESNKIFDGQNHTMDGTGTDYGFYFSGTSGWTIKNVNFSDWWAAIRNYGGHQNITIQDNTFSFCAATIGTIYLRSDCSGATISNNTFSNIYYGIRITDENNTNITIENNTIENITHGKGIDIAGQTDILIKGNDISIGGDSEHQGVYGMDVKIQEGVVEDNTIYDIWIGGHIINHSGGEDSVIYRNNNISNTTHGGLYLAGDGGTVENCTISNLDFSTTYIGHNYLVINNTLGDVELKGGYDNTIINNIVTEGFEVLGTYANHDVCNNNISDNNFTKTTTQVIKFYFSASYNAYNNTISSNTFNQSGGTAIEFVEGTNNTIEDNNLSNSEILLASATSNNKGCGNIGSIVDNGDNYVYNTTQGCPPCVPINLLYTIGNFWVNYTYEIEPCYPFANIDTFNISVNDIWTNSSVELFKNTSTIPHGWINITIYSFNSTEGRLSVSSISDQQQMPNNPVTITNCSDWSGTDGDIVELDFDCIDLDGDCTFSTNAIFGNLNANTGVFIWQTDVGGNGAYYWQFNVVDNYNGSTDNCTVTILLGGYTLKKFIDITETSYAFLGILAIVSLASLILFVLFAIRTGIDINFTTILIGFVMLLGFFILLYIMLPLFDAIINAMD